MVLCKQKKTKQIKLNLGHGSDICNWTIFFPSFRAFIILSAFTRRTLCEIPWELKPLIHVKLNGAVLSERLIIIIFFLIMEG